MRNTHHIMAPQPISNQRQQPYAKFSRSCLLLVDDAMNFTRFSKEPHVEGQNIKRAYSTFFLNSNKVYKNTKEGTESLKFKKNLRIMQGSSFVKTLRISVHLSCNAAFRLTFVVSMQYSLFCSTFVLLYVEVRHQTAFESIPLIFKRSDTFGL